MTPVHQVEFTIEPFVEGQPGQHVLAPIEAAHALGVEVELGPFGSSCVIREDQTPEVVTAIVRAAFDHGATNVNVDISRLDDARTGGTPDDGETDG